MMTGRVPEIGGVRPEPEPSEAVSETPLIQREPLPIVSQSGTTPNLCRHPLSGAGPAQVPSIDFDPFPAVTEWAAPADEADYADL
jgi:hypothetical protein